MLWEAVTLWKLFILDEEHSQMAEGGGGGGNKVRSEAKPRSHAWFRRGSAVQYFMLGSFWSVDLAVFVCPMFAMRLISGDGLMNHKKARQKCLFSEGHIHSSAEKLLIHFSLRRRIIRRIDEY